MKIGRIIVFVSILVFLTVTANAQLIARGDTFTVTTNHTEQTTSGSLFDNDLIDGAIPTFQTVRLRIVGGSKRSEGGFLLSFNLKGQLLVPADLRVGKYFLQYRICRPTVEECSEATVIVIVVDESQKHQGIVADDGNQTIERLRAQDDTFTLTVSSNTLTTPSIFDNDRLGTETPTTKTVILRVLGSSKDSNNNYLLNINLKGQLSVPAHTPAGTYYLHYQLCPLKGNAPCATATATVVLLYKNQSSSQTTPTTTTPTTTTPTTTTPTTTTPTTTTPTTTTPTTTTPTTTTPTTTTPTTTTPTTTTPTTSTPTTTTPTTNTLTTSTLTAQNDTFTITVSTTTLTTPSVFDNDRLGTETPTTKTVILRVLGGSKNSEDKYILNINLKGQLSVPAHTPAGTYYLHYQLCPLKGNAPCASATATVVLLTKNETSTSTPTTTTSTLIAKDDTFTLTISATTLTTPSVFNNDRLGTKTPTTKTVILRVLRGSKDSNNKYLLNINLQGKLSVPAHTPAGTYYLRYQLCPLKGNAPCATATATVVLLPNTPTSSTTTTPTTTTPTTTTPTTTTPTTTTPTTTTSTTSTSTTTTPSISTLIAKDNTFTLTVSSNTLTTPSVFDNDRLGTETPTTKTVILRVLGGSKNSANNYLLNINLQGQLSVPAHTPAGTYYLLYQLCPFKGDTPCAAATATVVLLAKTTTPTTSTPTTSTPTTSTPTTSTPTTSTPTTSTPTTSTPTTSTPTTSTPTTSTPTTSTPTTTSPTTTSPTTTSPTTTSPTTTSPTTTSPTTNTLIAKDDTFTLTISATTLTTPSVFDNDRLGTKTPTTKTVILRILGGSKGYNNNYLMNINLKGQLSVPAHTPAGTYYLHYQLCPLKGNAPCATATATVVLLPKTPTPSTTTTPTTTTPTTTTPTTTTPTTTTPTTTTPTTTTPTTTTPTTTTPTTTTPTTTTPTTTTPTTTTPTTTTPTTTTPTTTTPTTTTPTITTPTTTTTTPTTTTPTTTTPTTTTPTTTTPTTTTPTTTTPTTNTLTTNTPTINTLIAQNDTFTLTVSATTLTTPSIFNNDRIGSKTPTTKTVILRVLGGSKNSEDKYILNINLQGQLSVPAHTPAGTYYLHYQLCPLKGNAPCATATATVVLLPKTQSMTPSTNTPTTTTPTTTTPTTTTPTTNTPITSTLIAKDDTFTLTVSATTLTTPSIFNNDRIGSKTPTTKTVILRVLGGSKNSEDKYILNINLKGQLSVPAHTPAGTYYLLYQLCPLKGNAPCATATATVVLLAKTTTPTTSTTPTTTTPTTSTPTTSTPTTSTPTTSTPTINTLIAKDDTFTLTVSTTTLATPSVFNNDRFETETPTTKTVILRVLGGSKNSEDKYILNINLKGQLSVPAHTPAGTYYLHYQLCPLKGNAPCATATATVVLLTKNQTSTSTTSTPTTTTPTTSTPTINTLIAKDDTFTLTVSTTTFTTPSVFNNDRFETETPTTKTVILRVLGGSKNSEDKYILNINLKGQLSVPAHTPAGTYYLHYQLCPLKGNVPCAAATATVVLLAKTTTPTTSTTPTTTTPTTSTPTINTLIAKDDTFTLTVSTTTFTTPSVFNNDRLGTETPTTKTVILRVLGGSKNSEDKYILNINLKGQLSVPAHTPAGTYYLHYQLCSLKGNAPCATATATVVLLPKTQSITPTTNTPTTNTPTTNTPTTNTPTTNTPTTNTPTTNTPTTSTPTTNTPTTTTPTTNIPTTSTLIARDDTFTLTVSSNTLTTPSVFDNDRLGTETPTTKTVILRVLGGSKDSANNYLLNINLQGQLSVPAHTPKGTYYLLYQLCPLKGNAPCATATATVVLLTKNQTSTSTTTTPTTTTPTTTTPTTTTPTTTTPTTTTLIAQDDTFTLTISATTLTTPSVFDNDRFGSKTPTTKTVILRVLRGSKGSNNNYLLNINLKGELSVPAHTPAGTYYLLYQLCPLKGNAPCATATATVVLLPKTQNMTPTTNTPTITTPTTNTPTTHNLIAQDDTFTITVSTTTLTTPSIFNNDHIGSKTPTTKTVILRILGGSKGSDNNYLLNINLQGQLSIPAHTPKGTYYLHYQLCPLKGNAPCATATATVVLLPKTQSMTPSTNTPTTNTPTTNTPATNTPTTNTPTTNTPTTNTPTTNTPTTNTPTTNTPTTNTPTTNTSTTNAPTTSTLIAQDDTFTLTVSSNTLTTPSAFDNDRLGTEIPTTETVILRVLRGSKDSANNYLLNINLQGQLSVPAHTPAGTYYLHYQLCPLKGNAPCATATATVVLLANTPTSSTTTTPTTTTPTTTTPTTTTPTTTTSTTSTSTTNTPSINTLIAQDDTFTITVSATTLTTPSVFDNDRFGSKTPTTKTVILRVLRGSKGSNNNYLLNINLKGQLSVPAHTPAGTYYLHYQLCPLKGNAPCATATATVVLLPKTTTTTTPTTTTPTTTTPTTTTPTTTTPTTSTPTTTTPTTTTPTTTTPTTDTPTTTSPTTTTPTTPSTTTPSTTTPSTTTPSTTTPSTTTPSTTTPSTTTPSTTTPSTTTPTTTTPTTTTPTTTTPTTTTPTTTTPTTTTPTTTTPTTTTPTTTTPTTTTPTTTTPTTTTPTTTTPTTTTPTTTTPSTNTPTTHNLIAQDDTFTMTVSATTLTTPSVFNNDLLGTETPTSKTVVLKVIRGSKDAENNFLLSITLEGQISIPAHTPAGTYYLHYQLCPLKEKAPCATATATVVLLSEVITPESAQPSLVVYNGLSAQSIGINDHLHIKNIELYPQHSVCIFNRNGQKVFESSSYNNTTNVFRANSQTESIYFYLIQYLDAKNQPHSLTGYLYIKK